MSNIDFPQVRRIQAPMAANQQIDSQENRPNDETNEGPRETQPGEAENQNNASFGAIPACQEANTQVNERLVRNQNASSEADPETNPPENNSNKEPGCGPQQSQSKEEGGDILGPRP